MKRLVRLLVLAAAALLCALLPAGRLQTAAAHPMGNFSINHYAAVTVGPNAVQLLYLVDMAEIPTFQELNNLGVSSGTDLPPGRRAAYLRQKARALSAGLHVSLGSQTLPLQRRAADLLFPPGAGGLSTERIYLVLDAPLPRGSATLAWGRRAAIRYRDDNFSGRAGWKEVVATSAAGVRIVRSSVPAVSRSQALTIYPSSVTSSPPQDLAAALSVTAGNPSAPPLPQPWTAIHRAEAPLFRAGGAWSRLAQRLTAVGTNGGKGTATQAVPFSASRSDPLSDLMGGRTLSLGVVLLSLVLAFWFGAGHALSPGHGKTMVAAYLVGSRGTALHALILGLTVTVTHTAGVFALGLVTLSLSQYILPDQLYPWLGFISGLLVALMGGILFVKRVRGLAAGKLQPRVSEVFGARPAPGPVGAAPSGSPPDPGGLHHHRSRHGTALVFGASGPVGGGVLLGENGRMQFAPTPSATEGDAVPGENGRMRFAATEPSTTGVLAHVRAGSHVHDHNHGHVHGDHHDHSHRHDHDHDHTHHDYSGYTHRHGLFGRPHTHGPIAGNNSQGVRLRSLLALGVSGGLLPCPSALIVLLSAIAFHRVAFGIVLIVAFSAGLATTLTGIGMLVVFSGKLVGRLQGRRAGGRTALLAAARVLPVFSALVVALLGTLIAAGALLPGTLPGFLTRL